MLEYLYLKSTHPHFKMEAPCYTPITIRLYNVYRYTCIMSRNKIMEINLNNWLFFSFLPLVKLKHILSIISITGFDTRIGLQSSLIII